MYSYFYESKKIFGYSIFDVKRNASIRNCEKIFFNGLRFRLINQWCMDDLLLNGLHEKVIICYLK